MEWAAGRTEALGHVLAVHPLRYVGDRSYTFYLWHWPALIIADFYVGHQLGVGMNMLLLLGAFLLSIVTYALFENPIRRARWNLRASALLVPVSVASVIAVVGITLYSVDAKIAHAEQGERGDRTIGPVGLLDTVAAPRQPSAPLGGESGGRARNAARSCRRL